ncbi:MAG TPA: sigma-54 dependent transcriptional regulator [Rhodanobacteraceae bacterium]|nr:sigma-54 dependent transcriptional regulator [Rhodanobacteraceae bacterium]
MVSRMGHVLLLNAQDGLLELAAAAAKVAYCQLTAIADFDSARKLVAKKQFDLVLIDSIELDAAELNRFLELDLSNQGRIVVAGDAAPIVRAHDATAPEIEYVREPLSFGLLTRLMSHALSRTPSKEIPAEGEFSGMIGRTPRMQALFGNIRRVASLDVGVLVHGESGTGKELVARALHTLSGRPGKFVAVNCGALAPELLSSQIFGHERGSFTGATQSHAGYFEQAAGGTLFLDEITEMPYPLQVYLLRVIEARSLTRLGGSREIPLDVRIVAASNRDLQRVVEEGGLRQDLYFRLLEFPLAVPPLRERREDIPLLARHFLNLLNARYGTQKRISDALLHDLSLRAWPGNVRELRHVVQRLYILSGDAGAIDGAEPERPLQRSHPDPQSRAGEKQVPVERTGVSLDDGESIRFRVGMTLDDVERAVLLKTLAHCGNDKREAARVLGVSLKTVYNKLLRYRLRGMFEGVLNGSPEDSDRVAGTTALSAPANFRKSSAPARSG